MSRGMTTTQVAPAPALTSADLLRSKARLMRERAGAIRDGCWHVESWTPAASRAAAVLLASAADTWDAAFERALGLGTDSWYRNRDLHETMPPDLTARVTENARASADMCVAEALELARVYR